MKSSDSLYSVTETSRRRTFLPKRSLSALLAGVVLGLSGQPDLRAASSSAAADDEIVPLTSERLSQLTSASSLVGTTVKDQRKVTAGRIEDVLLDLPHGRVVVCLVVPTRGGQIIPVPARSFSGANKDYAFLAVDRKLLESAPKLAKTERTGAWDIPDLAESFRHFGQAQPAVDAKDLVSAVTLLHAGLVTESGEWLGRLKDIRLDLPCGQTVCLLAQPAAGLGAPESIYVLPSPALEPQKEGKTMALKTDRAHFLAGPHVEGVFAQDLTSRDLVLNVYRHYSLIAEDTSEPTPAVSKASDRDVSMLIMRELNGKPDLGAMAVCVSTSNGRVQLSGSVTNEKQKRQVLAVAERIAGAGNIDDQIQLANMH